MSAARRPGPRRPKPAGLPARSESVVGETGILPIPAETALALDLVPGDLLLGEPEGAILVLEPSRNLMRALIGLPAAELGDAIAAARLPLTAEIPVLAVLHGLAVPLALFPLHPGDRVTVVAERTPRGFRLHLELRLPSPPSPPELQAPAAGAMEAL